MIAEILCVGTELLLGNIVNTNAQFLAQKCAEYGLFLYNQQVVGDNEERLEKAFSAALERADIIITTGGLGPTNDDITKEVICRTLGLSLERDQASYDAMVSYFKKMGGRVMTDNNLKQAAIPLGGQALINHNGTAPAVLIETDKTSAKEKYPHKIIVLLPGPPKEMIPLVEEYLDPYFKHLGQDVIYSETLKLVGIGESQAADKIDEILRTSVNPTVAPYAKTGEVHLRITAKAMTEDDAKKLIQPVKANLYELLGEYIYTDREELELEDVVIALAKEKGLKISTAESCTGGLLSGRLINVSGASDAYMQGFVTYSNEAKISAIHVPEEIIETYGAVSSECAEKMAEGCAKAACTDIALSTTGIAGPLGGTDEKPVGLVYIGCYVNGETEVHRRVFNGDRRLVRERAVNTALTILWRRLRSTK